MKNRYVAPLLLFFCFSNFLTAQELYSSLQEKLPPETMNQPYTYVDRALMPTSPAYRAQTPNYFTKQVNIDANGNNIVGDAANEPSIAIDPTNPNRVVIGWRQFDDVGNDFRQAGYGYSINGGYTWTFPGVLEPGVFRSDPVLDFDRDGNFYYNSLQSDFECDVFAIRDGGVVWEGPVPAQGGDKQWMRIDKTSGASEGHNYSYWNNSFTTCAGSFTRSTDDATAFEPCVDIPGDPFWGTLAVDADANLYLTGTTGGSLVVVKSVTAKDPTNVVSFSSSNPVNLDGALSVGEPINPQGLVGQAWVDVDVSNGPGRNNVYVVASVERNSNNDPADVMFAKSTNGGQTFGAPIRINTDAGTSAYQWFGTMSVAPNGRIDVIWLDTRDAPVGTFDSVLYYSFSEDQGTTWSDNTAISEPFDPTIGYPVQQKMGDYFDMKSDDAYAHVAWAGTFTGGQDVYYTRISPDGSLAIDDFSTDQSEVTIAPNPVTNETVIQFSTTGTERATVIIYDILGKKVAVVLDANVSGNQRLVWNASSSAGNKVSAGIYFVEIQTTTSKHVKRVIVQ